MHQVGYNFTYPNTIISKVLEVDAAHRVILAILFHNLSTQEDPHHPHCITEWCFYQQVITDGI